MLISSENHLANSTSTFKSQKLTHGDLLHNSQPDSNHLFFLLEGEAIFNNIDVIGKNIQSGTFFFIPFSSEMTIEAVSTCKFIIFSFDNFVTIYEQIYFRELSPFCNQTEQNFEIIRMNPSITYFINDIAKSLELDFDQTEIQQLKHEELICLLSSTYTAEEMASIFYPIAGKSYDFRKLILKNYLKIKNIEDLVQCTGLKRKTFDRQFTNEFNVAPYQWILNQKAKHIKYALSETTDKMSCIMKKYGFSIAPHFTRFCREQFGFSPMELRKKLQRARL
ncbi:MAG: AraC family transcriptional regulator [Tannerellaceae bacterium]|jgi:AraC-like DNA-binding protein|nr:AraC family transcriptional regulator [Tannerellaceae bacterium]